MKRTAILAALAALTILSAPAQARKAKVPAVAPRVDVAAIPPYPTDDQATTPHNRRAAGRGSAAATRAVRDSHLSRETSLRPSQGQIGSGIVKSGKTGATAHVAPRYAAIFQDYVDDVEAAGGRITFMGGLRPGRCHIPESKHPCGMAIDLCQYSRGVVDHRCLLPSEGQLAQIAARHGLVEGGIWCHGDRGHAEIRTHEQAEACGHNLYTAVTEFQAKRTQARHHHIRYARR